MADPARRTYPEEGGAGLHLSLSPGDQASVHQLLLAVPEPGSSLLPPRAVQAEGRLVVADVLCVSEIDRRGFVIQGFDEPTGSYDHLGPQCCDGLPPLGLQHLA